MVPDSAGWLRGATSVAWWDLKVNLRGRRLWIVTLLILVAFLGPVFGLSQLLLPLGPGATSGYIVWLVGIVVPVLAGTMSYDSISRERATGSLEMLLARPLSRPGLAVGKFLGAFVSVTLPLLIVAPAAILAIHVLTGNWPGPAFSAILLLGTVGLAALYILVGEMFSALTKTSAGALVSAAFVWLLFSFLWSPATVGMQAVLRMDSSFPGFPTFSTMAALFNPTGVYNVVVLAFLPGSSGPGFGSVGGLPTWMAIVAWLVWFLVLMALAIGAVHRRTE
jgi:Cu-processing system permease protein